MNMKILTISFVLLSMLAIEMFDCHPNRLQHLSSEDGIELSPSSPRPGNQRKKCSQNEEFHECGTVCPDTCQNKDKERPCPMICRSGCFCRQGFVRSGRPSSKVSNELGECIRADQCPK